MHFSSVGMPSIEGSAKGALNDPIAQLALPGVVQALPLSRLPTSWARSPGAQPSTRAPPPMSAATRRYDPFFIDSSFAARADFGGRKTLPSRRRSEQDRGVGWGADRSREKPLHSPVRGPVSSISADAPVAPLR